MKHGLQARNSHLISPKISTGETKRMINRKQNESKEEKKYFLKNGKYNLTKLSRINE